jgi:hypothetical protein
VFTAAGSENEYADMVADASDRSKFDRNFEDIKANKTPLFWE